MFFWTFYSLKNPKKLYQGIAKNIYLPLKDMFSFIKHYAIIFFLKKKKISKYTPMYS